MPRSKYLKEPYLSNKYRKAKLWHPNQVWKVLLAGKDINVPQSIRNFKATKDPRI